MRAARQTCNSMHTLLLTYFSSTTDLIQYGGFALVLLMVFIETGFLIGIFIPGGGSLLLTVGLLCGSHVLPTPIYFMIPSVIIAATLGDLMGYSMGRWLGPALEQRGDTWFFKKRHLLRARQFYHEHGLTAIVIGRFLPFIRTFNPLLAGIARLGVAQYLMLCLTGTCIWVTTIMGSSYLIGQQFPALKKNFGLVLIGILLVSLLPVIYRWATSRPQKSQL